MRWEVFAEAGGSFFNEKHAVGREYVFNPATGIVTINPTDLITKVSNTARFFGGVRWYLAEHRAFELSYSAGPNNLSSTDRIPGNLLRDIRTDRDASVHFASLNYVHSFSWGRRWKPFITGGVGFGAASWLVLGRRKDSTRFAGNIGGGVDFSNWRRVSLRLEYRAYLFRPFMVFADLPVPGGVMVHHGPSAGFAFRF